MTTLISCLTPAGTGAIATIGLQGPTAWDLTAALLPESRRASPRRFLQASLGETADRAASDQVVITVDSLPIGQRVMIHCHGGLAVVRWIMDLLCARGAQEVDWPEWLRRTACGRIQADAAVALANAPTLRVAGILLDQYHGALDIALREALQRLSEGDLPGARRLLGSLLENAALGLHLTETWKVVLAGAPNVGKSSLLNALVGYQRAITSPIPGTTRDRVTAVTACDGWPIELIDTAGLSEAAAGLEAAGIQHTHQSLADADLVLWLIEPANGRVADDMDKSQLVLNKIDLLGEAERRQISADVWLVSAKTKEELPGLLQRIAHRLVPQPPPSGAAVPFTGAQIAGLRAARAALAEGRIAAARTEIEGLIQPCSDAADLAAEQAGA